MAHWCESCGQELPAGEMPADATWIGEPGAHQHRAAPGGKRDGGRDKKLLLGVGGIVAAWVLFVVLARIVSPGSETAAAPDQADPIDQTDQVTQGAGEQSEDDATQSTAETDPSPYQAADAEPGEAGFLALPDAQGEDTLDGVGEPESDAIAIEAAQNDDGLSSSRVINTVQVERIQRQLGRRNSNAVVMYRASEGIVVVDLRAGTSEITPLTTGATTADPGTRLLRSGSDTFGINPETMAVAQVVDDSSIVVTRARSGGTYFVDAASLRGQAPRIVVQADDEDSTVGTYLVPTGHQLIPFDGLGLVAVPKGPTGPTLVATGDAVEILSEARVLAANDRAMLLQVCATPISCVLEVESFDEDGARWVVPADFVRLGDNYVLSPDGLSLLRYTDEGFAEVYGSGDDSVSWVIGAGMEVPAWGPSSRFIAWLDLVGDPKVKVMFPDERDWLTIDLGDLGAPRPVGPEIIVFTPTSGPADS